MENISLLSERRLRWLGHVLHTTSGSILGGPVTKY